MTPGFLAWLKGLIASGNVHLFYVHEKWKAVAAEVRKLDHDECQLCKSRGKFSRAEIVHHVNHVKKRPELALDIYYIDGDGNRKRNLISVCKDCHEVECHPERLRRSRKQGFTTAERWD